MTISAPDGNKGNIRVDYVSALPPKLYGLAAEGGQCNEQNAAAAICGDPRKFKDATVEFPDRTTTCNNILHKEDGWIYKQNNCQMLAKWCCSGKGEPVPRETATAWV